MDHRICPIIPNESEIFHKRNDIDLQTFVKALTDQYDSVDSYLIRQFYLLREDCFYDLISVIRSIRSGKFKLNSTTAPESNVWIYNDVQIFHYSFSFFKIINEVKFPLTDDIDWEESGRLKFGSLLFLSCDQFKSYHVATVADSDIKDLKNGVVKIEFLDNKLMSLCQLKQNFCMIETQSYFESYIHVLKRLQILNKYSFPFPNYFLFNKITPKKQNLIFDIICKDKLNESQQRAYVSSLTQDLTLIQGPPGTGKTFLGVKIVEKLLTNYIEQSANWKPILIVCYTNHALDQFLEKLVVISRPGKVVRIGSKSESEIIKKQCSIKIFVDQWKSKKQFPKSLAIKRSEITRQLSLFKNDFLLKQKHSEKENILFSISENEMINYRALLKQFDHVKLQEHQSIMASMHVIGMTTTACARYAEILDDLGVEVMIIEEAAEVLECNVVCSINSKCRQLIMIGDHKQLPPSTSVYKICKDFDFDCSLFERLVRINYPLITLTEQRRMRPEISHCILSIYPQLTNHPSVMDYASVPGMRINLYFFHHNHIETKSLKTSFKNDFEIRFVKGLYSFLIDRGIKPNQITILSTYKGQNNAIKDQMKDVNCCVVDSYQGDENDIIILALVRSNENENIGYLKMENRICVALSRARHGMFIVGNLNMVNKYRFWKKAMINGDNSDKNYGSKLPIKCKRNESHDLSIVNVNDFYRKDLCNKICGKPLDCQKHYCKSLCHDSPNHTCQEIVQKSCRRNEHMSQVLCRVSYWECLTEVTTELKCGHWINHRCHNKPPMCQVLVLKTLRCNHKQTVVCSTEKEKIVCNKQYPQLLRCGHQYMDCIPYPGLCNELIRDFELICGHRRLIKCFEKNYHIKCDSLCGKVLSCGHLCQNLCKDCISGRLHRPCQTKCQVKLICGHMCRDLCHMGSCQGCLSDCLISALRRISFSPAQKVSTDVVKNWIRLKDSVINLGYFSFPRFMIKLFERIINYLSLTKLKKQNLEQFASSFEMFEDIVEFYRSQILSINFDEIWDFKEIICESIYRLMEWISPFLSNVLKSDKKEFEMEYQRLKDLSVVCQLFQNNIDKRYFYRQLLCDIENSYYNEKQIIKIKRIINDIHNF